MEKWFSYIVKTIELLRPKFYNKLTWVVVISGLSLMTTPLWVIIAGIILETKYEISITGSSDIGWGFSLCCLGIAYHLISNGLHELALTLVSKEKNDKIFSHDAAVFEKLNRLLDEEELEATIAGIETNDAIYWDEFIKLGFFSRKASSSNSTFISRTIKDKTEALVSALNDLRIFINKEFDEYPYGQGVQNFRMCLAPNLNCDRAGQWEDGQKYDVLVKQMMHRTRKCLEEYRSWRTEIKTVLFI